MAYLNKALKFARALTDNYISYSVEEGDHCVHCDRDITYWGNAPDHYDDCIVLEAEKFVKEFS
jgi:hypothetical protein